MARISYSEADKYASKGTSGGYFSLKNDMDVARVRFLYNTVEDMEGYSVHEVEIEGKRRFVNCPREYDSPLSDCPFCAKGKPAVAKWFIPIFNEDTKTVQVWERGVKMKEKLEAIFKRYSKAPIVSQIFEIERHGKACSTQTSYEIYRTDDPADNAKIEDYEMPNVNGGIVKDMSIDDMSRLANGSSNDSAPWEDVAPETFQRRAPRGDRF